MQRTIAAVPILCGLVVMVVGLTPGLLEGLMDGIANFRASLGSISPRFPRRISIPAGERRRWFVGVGTGFLVLGMLALVSN